MQYGRIHTLVITEVDGTKEWDIIHPSSCPIEYERNIMKEYYDGVELNGVIYHSIQAYEEDIKLLGIEIMQPVYDCDVEYEVVNAGIDGLDVTKVHNKPRSEFKFYDWMNLEEGMYELRAWHNTYHDYEYGDQYEGGLELLSKIEKPPIIIHENQLDMHV